MSKILKSNKTYSVISTLVNKDLAIIENNKKLVGIKEFKDENIFERDITGLKSEELEIKRLYISRIYTSSENDDTKVIDINFTDDLIDASRIKCDSKSYPNAEDTMEIFYHLVSRYNTRMIVRININDKLQSFLIRNKEEILSILDTFKINTIKVKESIEII